MKNVIVDKALYSDYLSALASLGSFCIRQECSLVRLHENANLYSCVAGREGIPCDLYVGDSVDSINVFRASKEDVEWIEVLPRGNQMEVNFCHKAASGAVVRSDVKSGEKTSDISAEICNSMRRNAPGAEEIFFIQNKKNYDSEVCHQLQKRSVLDLGSLDSSGVDIVYFSGAEQLVEKLLYGGCRELTIYLTRRKEMRRVRRALEEISRRAPFTNRLTLVVTDNYSPTIPPSLAVGMAEDLREASCDVVFLFKSRGIAGKKELYIGQNTVSELPSKSAFSLKMYTIHYITSILSELVLNFISKKGYGSRKLFKVCATTLETKTIIGED